MRDGALQEQTAPLVVLACNGVGTPRLLLNSRSPQFPDGLANRSGLVGKNLMFHCFASVGGVFPEPLESCKRANRLDASSATSSTRPTRSATSCAAISCRSCGSPAR